MFRPPIRPRGLGTCFPRIRGDVPHNQSALRSERWFSPHTRGCSYDPFLMAVLGVVFPAYAGMFRHDSVGLPTFGGFPRIRGDVPRIKPDS